MMGQLSAPLVLRYLPEVRSRLVDAARDRRMLGYKELADLVGMNQKHLYDVLNALDLQEHEHQRPIISAIVVRKRERKPGVGFYRLLAQLRHTSGEEDLGAWEAERDRVWSFDWPDGQGESAPDRPLSTA